MSTTASQNQPRHYPSRPPVGVLDWLMLALAIVSTGYLVWITVWDVPPATEQIVFRIDYVVCAIFAAEFAWRWRNAGWSWKFPLVYWYEVLGMIPVAVPWLRSLRLLRVVAIISRTGRAADRAIGDRVTNAVISRVTGALVQVVKRPITVAVLDEVALVLQSGHYTRNISAALRENQDELDAMILELIRNDPTAGRLRYLPFHDDIVRLVADTVFRIVFEVLDDDRTDELISDMLRENIDQIKAAVQGKYEGEGPVAPLHVVGFLSAEEAPGSTDGPTFPMVAVFRRVTAVTDDAALQGGPTTEQVAVARAYIDALVSHDGASVSFAPDAVRHELGLKTGWSGNHLRRSLSRGPQFRTIIGVRDLVATVEGDVVHTEYLLDAGVFGRRLMTVRIIEDFVIPAGDLRIHRITAKFRPV